MPEHMEPHAAAYRESTKADWADDEWMQELFSTGGLIRWAPDDPTPTKPPERWEADAWDLDREPPKTPDEARRALLERIADPAAPDTEAELGAYDGEGA